MNIYISGKIGEDPISDRTREKFDQAQQELEAAGHHVFNPASKEWQDYLITYYPFYRELNNIDYYTYVLLRDLQEITTVDALYMLADYTDSPGALTEYRFAQAIKKKIIKQK